MILFCSIYCKTLAGCQTGYSTKILQPPGSRPHCRRAWFFVVEPPSLHLKADDMWINTKQLRSAFCPPSPLFSCLAVWKPPSQQQALGSGCRGKLQSCFWASTGPGVWGDASGWHCTEVAHTGASTPVRHGLSESRVTRSSEGCFFVLLVLLP